MSNTTTEQLMALAARGNAKAQAELARRMAERNAKVVL